MDSENPLKNPSHSKRETFMEKSVNFTTKSWENNLNLVQKLSEKIEPFYGKIFLFLFITIYHVYLVAAGIHNYQKASSLIYFTIFCWFAYFLNLFSKTEIFQKISQNISTKLDRFECRKRLISVGTKLSLIAIFLAFTVYECSTDYSRLTGFIAYAFFIFFMFIMSSNRKRINWKIVSNSLILHYFIAIVILQWPAGKLVFENIAQLVVGFLNFAQVGAKFVFGFVADPPNICNLSPAFVFTSLQTLIYFASIVAILFHFGVIQIALEKMTWIMDFLIGTTAVESLNACASTIFGMTEAPLFIAPYIEQLTDSELFAILTSGLSCVAGTVFAAYVSLGACPDSLLTASILSAPLSLGCSKILEPDTEVTRIDRKSFRISERKSKSFIDTVFSAGVALVPTVFAVAATLVIVMSTLALLDTVMEYIGDLIGFREWSFQMLFGYLFFPLAYMMGVTEDANQTFLVAQLMGTKTAVNEFVAYNKLGKFQNNNILTPKSVLVATYALCGFSNFSSMGMQIEFLGGIAPGKRAIISKLVFRALIAGSIVNFMNATVAGILVSSPTICKSIHSNSTCFNIP